MSVYPSPAAGQGLYEASTKQKMDLGTIHHFETAKGPVMAMYCQNNNTASVAAGLAVGMGVDGQGYCNTAAVAAASLQKGLVLGGLAASMAASSTAVTATDGGFGWVIMRGPQTNAFWAATQALSAAARGVAVSSNAGVSTCATTHGTATNSSENVEAVALVRAFTPGFSTTGTAAAAAIGVTIDWMWR